MRSLLILFVMCGVLAGCSGSDTPDLDTYQVTGKISYRSGEPVSGGTIEFQSLSDQTLNMSSAIESDGSFALMTIYENQNLSGAIAGPCQVMLTLPMPNTPIPALIVLPQPYQVDPTTNHFEISLDFDAPSP